ncbi:hypothetical protein KFU94_04890 [Chloroflexi bacterium TSY]|nr:hypothetical protein [Chloroflexi bacterium TSY]
MTNGPSVQAGGRLASPYTWFQPVSRFVAQSRNAHLLGASPSTDDQYEGHYLSQGV